MMLAAIDAGSNTLRLLIGEVVNNRVVPHVYCRRITRLVGGFTELEGLSREACERALSAFQSFASVCRENGVRNITAVGTAAFRQAVNGSVFAEEIKTSTGIALEIISGDAEASYMVQGVLSALAPVPENALIVDIGGGSTEFVLCLKGRTVWSTSLPLGVVRLTEISNSFEVRSKAINKQLLSLEEELVCVCKKSAVSPSSLAIVGTAGTVTTMAALDMQMAEYDWRRVNNYTMTLTGLLQWQEKLLPLTAEQRERLPGMEAGRGDLIVAGLEIMISLMQRLKSTSLTISDFGILEGLLLDLHKTHKT